jgi:hypothetical protein
MASLVPSMLWISLAVIGLVVVVWRVAARREMKERTKVENRWRWTPPIASGARLILWGAEVAEAIARKVLHRKPTRQLPTEIASEILTGTGFAIRHLPFMDSQFDFGDCRHRRFRRVGVTAPEVLAIADKIRSDELQSRRIHDLALENVRRLSEGGDGRFAHGMTCPLRTDAGGCLAGSLCPLQCRAHCDLTDTVDPEHVKTLESVSRDVGFGVEVGLSRALVSAGLDGHVYELNSALAAALEHPDASERWARGESVLDKCMPEDYTAYLE